MRRHAQYIMIAALIAAVPVIPVRANPVEFLDRIVTFTADTLNGAFSGSPRKTRIDPCGPTPFRVALMLPKSGGLREAAERVARGREIALAMSDHHVAEYPVSLILVDTSQGIEKTLNHAAAMLEKPGIDVFAGVVGANTAGAMAQFEGQHDKPLILAGAIGSGVMSRACYPHVARTSFNIDPHPTTRGRFIATQYKTFVSIGPDTKGGHRIVHQYSRSGTKRHTDLTGPEWFFGPRVMNRRGKHAAGTRFLTSYLPERETPANRIVVDAYRKAYGEDPDSYAYMGYENAIAVLLIAADLSGQVHGGAEFIAAMKKVSFAGLLPRGDFSLNQTNSAFLKRLYWVKIVHGEDSTRERRLATIPIDPDNSTCKEQTARNAY